MFRFLGRVLFFVSFSFVLAVGTFVTTDSFRERWHGFVTNELASHGVHLTFESLTIDRILHIGFGGKECGLESFRQFERLQRILRGHRRRITRLAVVGLGEVGGENGGGESEGEEDGLHGGPGA